MVPGGVKLCAEYSWLALGDVMVRSVTEWSWLVRGVPSGTGFVPDFCGRAWRCFVALGGARLYGLFRVGSE